MKSKIKIAISVAVVLASMVVYKLFWETQEKKKAQEKTPEKASSPKDWN
jgi:hypothetical protein